MNNYLVSIHDNNSWRRIENERLEATSAGTAGNRAFQIFRKKFKGRKIQDVTIKIRTLKTA